MTDLGRFWSLTGRDFDAGECLILAIKRHSDGCAGASALPLKADIGNARTGRTQKADIGCLLNPYGQADLSDIHVPQFTAVDFP